eukprot:Phypoly_transcript_13689.p1 GENE.Phypoly_transcript_13689~~Phypoly_transcript_13689.p1  ORF type:complete len:281 (+),score=48.22 Phypoly_transcript_13689:1-843(+)
MACITKGGVAAITGGAKGIGFAVAKALAKSGMRVALADTDQAALTEATNQLVNLQVSANDIFTSVTNVANLAEVQAFKDAVYNKFGEVTILMNNAGISQPSSSWGHAEQWKQIMDVNFTGELNGQLAFIPQMLAQGKPGAIINVGSKQGITNPPGNPAYSVSKAAVKTMTEQLAHELRNTAGCKLSAHLLVPGYTHTPLTARGPLTEKPAGAWTPDQVAERLIQGLKNNEFYIICPDNEVTWELDQKRIQWAAEDLIKGRPALSRWHPDYSAQFTEFLQK